MDLAMMMAMMTAMNLAMMMGDAILRGLGLRDQGT